MAQMKTRRRDVDANLEAHLKLICFGTKLCKLTERLKHLPHGERHSIRRVFDG
jgi:hypothetical protein